MLKPGRIARERRVGPVRELTKSDLEELRKPRAQPAAARFRDSHHMVARLFASGLKATAVAQRTGYSLTRVVQLRNDPSFEELIANYRGMVDESFKENVDDFIELATSNMLKAERQIADRLDQADSEEETLPVRELVAISRDAADRFGYGKKTTNLNLNVDFAAQLDRAIKRSGKVLEINGNAQKVALSPSPPGARSIGAASGRSYSPEPFRRRAVA